MTDNEYCKFCRHLIRERNELFCGLANKKKLEDVEDAECEHILTEKDDDNKPPAVFKGE